MAILDVLRKANDERVVVGLASAGVAPRLDIDQAIATQPYAFNLFLLALEDLTKESVDWTNPMTYFQTAGIHGLPRKMWDEVFSESKAKMSKNWPMGYCPHGTLYFPTWHRPYVMMMEQLVYLKMVEKGQEFKDFADHKAEVDRFRLPYFDYYRPRDWPVKEGAVCNYDIPQIFTLPSVMVKLPSGASEMHDNPLRSFTFPKDGVPADDWKFMGMEAWATKRTVRYSQYPQPVLALNKKLNQIREDSTRMPLTWMENGAYNDFEIFVSEGIFNPDPNAPSGSLEGLHGDYHGHIGGVPGQGNHMSRVPSAGFDPVFWFHHCQIDRWFAIWQAANPNSWLPSQQEDQADLLPFRKTKQPLHYWNSGESRDTRAFGYTYPDISGIENDSEQVRANFKAKYEWSRRLVPTDHFGMPPKGMEPLDLSTAQAYQFPKDSQAAKEFKHIRSPPVVFTARVMNQAHAVKEAVVEMTDGAAKSVASKGTSNGTSNGITDAAPAAQQVLKVGEEINKGFPPSSKTSDEPIDESSVSREWYIDDVVKRLAMNGSFTIFYFIGKYNKEKPMEYLLEKSNVGINHVFAAPTELCDNCGTQAEQAQKVANTTPMTSMLLDYCNSGELASMRPEHVGPFLIKNLKWKIVTINGEVQDPRQVPGFSVSISCKVAGLPPAPANPVYERYDNIIAEILRNAS